MFYEGKTATIPQMRPWDDRTHPPPDPITIMKTVGEFLYEILCFISIFIVRLFAFFIASPSKGKIFRKFH